MNAKIRFRRKFPSKCNKPIVKWYKPHGAIHQPRRHLAKNIDWFHGRRRKNLRIKYIGSYFSASIKNMF